MESIFNDKENKEISQILDKVRARHKHIIFVTPNIRKPNDG